MSNDRDREAAEECIPMLLWAGELSSKDNLKHLHVDLVRQIVEQTWSVAMEAGRSSALKELEQVAREAFAAGRYGKYTRNSIMPRPLLWSEVQHDFDYKEFEDYWQQKTESKEAND